MDPLVKVAAIRYIRRKRKQAAAEYLVKQAWKGAVLGLGALGGTAYLGGKTIDAGKNLANIHARAPSITNMNRMRFGSRATPRIRR